MNIIMKSRNIIEFEWRIPIEVSSPKQNFD